MAKGDRSRGEGAAKQVEESSPAPTVAKAPPRSLGGLLRLVQKALLYRHQTFPYAKDEEGGGLPMRVKLSFGLPMFAVTSLVRPARAASALHACPATACLTWRRGADHAHQHPRHRLLHEHRRQCDLHRLLHSQCAPAAPPVAVLHPLAGRSRGNAGPRTAQSRAPST